MKTAHDNHDATNRLPLGPKVQPETKKPENGGWVKTGQRNGYDVWKHADGRLATTPSGQVPDTKLMPKAAKA